VKVIFKDLTYETITDEKFVAQLKKSFPGLSQHGFFEEHDSAPELRLAGNAAKSACELRREVQPMQPLIVAQQVTQGCR
jgi:hypothetical protein